MFENKRDKIEFINPNTNEIELMNHRTFLMLIHGILTHYLRYTKKAAQNLIEHSFLYDEPSNTIRAGALTHELVYHWAMLLAYGNQYWNNGYTSDEPSDYYSWEDQYISEHDLAKEVLE